MEMESFHDLKDMQFDTFEQIPDWEAIQLAESRALVEELACEGPFVFEDDLVTLHHFSYQKDTKNILLQRVSVKGKHVT